MNVSFDAIDPVPVWSFRYKHAARLFHHSNIRRSDMSRLPPPPRFTIPPPPMPPADSLSANLFAQLTCSSMRQSVEPTWTLTRLFLFASAICLITILLFTITLIWLLAIRKQKQFHRKQHEKPSQMQPSATTNSINDWSTNSHRSYATISTEPTGEYVESADTSATMCSVETDSAICVECQRHPYYPARTHYYHVVNVPDLVPS